jgi:uridine kinase
VTVLQLEPGEPAAGPWSALPLGEVVQRLQAAAGTPVGRPRIVAIDGRGGVGKSTLVDLLQLQVPRSAVVHTDDVAWHHSFFDWADLLTENVLLPLHRGEAVDHRPAAWEQRGRAGSIAVPAGLDTVWLEGTGVLRTQLQPLLDASVWLQADREEAARRLLNRDGAAPEQLQLVEDWLREEHPFLLREQPWAHATLIVAGSAVAGRLPTGHVAVAAPVAAGT